ncbi:MAG: phosphodiesterase [Sulfurospirillum sp.]
MKFIQISDPHLIGDERPSLYGIDPNFRLDKAFESIKKWHSDAKFVVITGDLSNSASDLAYAKLQTVIKNSKFSVYPILGNHDKRDIFKSYFSEFTNDGFIQYAKKIDDKAFLFLDTLMEDKSYGELCDSRIKWLKNQLEIYNNKFLYIFMHHHPISCGMHEMDTVANFKTQQKFWDLLKPYKNIKHISFGHIHRIMHSSKNGISLHSTRSTTFQVAYKPDNKVEYLTNEENPTYAIINIDKDGNTRVHHHEYLSEDRFYLGEC